MLCVALGFAACTPEPDDVVAKSEIRLSVTDVEFAERGETKSVSYEIVNPKSGENIVAVTEAEWVEVSAKEAGVLEIKAEGNFTHEQRSAEVTLKYASAQDVVMTLTQDYVRTTTGAPLEVELVDYDATTITVSVITEDPELTWVPMVTYKESWDYYKGNQNDIFQADLEYFQYLAGVYDLTLAERSAVCSNDSFSKVSRCAAREKFDFVDSHINSELIYEFLVRVQR